MLGENRIARREQAGALARRRNAITPACDIFENDDEVLLVADVPGVTNEGLSVEIDRGELRIEASREDVQADGGVFRRVFTVPDGIDADNVSAQLDDGVLRVHLPKSEDVKAKRIDVKSA